MRTAHKAMRAALENAGAEGTTVKEPLVPMPAGLFGISNV